MFYDIFANFYEKANSNNVTFRCPLGVMDVNDINYFKNRGFNEDDGTPAGYLDYRKEIEADELPEWTQEGYISEVMDVLYCGKDFERIMIEAEELDVIESPELLPIRGLPVSECFVKFGSTEPFAPVTFIDGDPYDMTENTRSFIIPLKKLKDYFDVMTMMEVMERMQTFANGNPWTYEQLKDYFEAGIDDAVDLATRVFFGKRDWDGNPEILHALHVGMQGENKTQMMAGFLHDVVEDSDLTLEDLAKWGFSQEVVTAVDLLTHRDDVSYKDYLIHLTCSLNLDAIAVKVNDLKHNIERGKAGGHTRSVKKHQEALDFVLEMMHHIQEQFAAHNGNGTGNQ